MTGQQLATRLGVRQSTVAKLERGEQEGTVTLRSLRNAAEAMECDLVYALVPRRSLEATLEQQARRQAARIVGRVEHTMALEGQEGSTVTVDEVVADLAEELVRTMSPEIWRAE
jgi:predicted DNA-binding mobile mystery protein A